MEPKHLRRLSWILVSLVLLSSLLVVVTMKSRGKIAVGGVEDVVLLPWGEKISARIDTGAATSSLDARDIKAPSRDLVEFTLPDRCGGHRVRRPLVGWRSVKSSNGATERRPVVMIDLVLGPKRLRTLVTLTDRSQMQHPLLIGRKTLKTLFVVDVNQTNLVAPVWAEGPEK
ncbi:MAG: ATP-dependent zinc protease [Verrucomicrobia bacterium]|nr:ATP-dependent zinc protease [Verrucomicrobiota bacterium]